MKRTTDLPDEGFEREKAPGGRLSFIAMGRSGCGDTAETHEDLLFRDLEPHGGAWGIEE